jgi:hypothetical protein
MPIAQNRFPSEGMPEPAFFQNGEIEGYRDGKQAAYVYENAQGKFSLLQDWKHHELRRGYKASVTFMDSAVQRVLASLDSLNLRENTWVVFHADHGYSLGERGEWAKQNLFEEAARVPLIIAPPTGPAGQGFRTNATFAGIAELVDVFPTLVDLLGVPPGVVPPGQLEGDSLVGALRLRAGDEGGEETHGSAFTAAYTEISRGDNVGPTSPPADGTIQGLSVRVPNWRLNAWVPFDFSKSSPLWGEWNESLLVELYNYPQDTGAFEDYDGMELANLAFDPKYARVVQQLAGMARAQWPGE